MSPPPFTSAMDLSPVGALPSPMPLPISGSEPVTVRMKDGVFLPDAVGDSKRDQLLGGGKKIQ